MSGVLEFQGVQYAMSSALALCGLLFLHTALVAQRFDRYGREALILAGLFLLQVSVTRVLGVAGVLDTVTNRTINSIAATIIAALILQTGYLSWCNWRNGYTK